MGACFGPAGNRSASVGTRMGSTGTRFGLTWDSLGLVVGQRGLVLVSLGTRWDSLWVSGDSFQACGDSLCASSIDERTPSEKLVYNRGRGNDGTRLIANQRRPISTAKVKAQYQSRRLYPAPSTGRTSRSTAHTAGGPRSAGERYHLEDGGAHLVRRRMLTP